MGLPTLPSDFHPESYHSAVVRNPSAPLHASSIGFKWVDLTTSLC